MGVATPYTGWEAWDHTKIAIKLILTVIITILAFVGRRKPRPQTGIWGAIGGLVDRHHRHRCRLVAAGASTRGASGDAVSGDAVREALSGDRDDLESLSQAALG